MVSKVFLVKKEHMGTREVRTGTKQGLERSSHARARFLKTGPRAVFSCISERKGTMKIVIKTRPLAEKSVGQDCHRLGSEMIHF